MIAEVLVDIEHHQIDQRFDYEVPSSIESYIQVGQRIEVPFGPRKITGFVMHLKTTSDIKNLKAIHAVRDLFPYLDQERVALGEYLSKRHIHPKIAYYNGMLPSALAMKYTTLFTCENPDLLHASIREAFVTDKTVPRNNFSAAQIAHIKNHLEAGDLTQTLSMKQKTNVRTVQYIVLKNPQKVKGVKQQAIIDYLETHGPTEKKQLLEAINTTMSPVNALLEKEIIDVLSKERYREIASLMNESDKAITFTEEQSKIIESIQQSLGIYHEHLIHGVTSSGKTEVYIELVKTVLNQGKQAIILLPEIALTPKIVARFKAALNESIALFHSALSTGEQYDEWRKMLNQEVNVCIGTRSAAFAPFNNLGIIIVDEEQSDSFVQRERAPYHTKEVVRFRGAYHHCPIVYGSATPSVETYHEAKTGVMSLHEMKKRALDAAMPTIKLIDMKAEFKSGNPSIFSKALQEKIAQTLKKKEQILLLINRRGHANFVICRDCGKRIKCPNCDISLTYHHHDDSLKCHYCSHHISAPKQCPSCNAKHIRYMGLGSEKVEMSLRKTFPQAKIYRMDKDNTTKKGAHEKIIDAFEKDGDILVGTQMITKGLDFENVTLAGVLSADMSLFIPDFYAESETYAMLTQIAGRAGRRHKQGHVFIQAYDVDHPVLDDVKRGDYQSFFDREIAFRRAARVEPFKKLTQILCVHKHYDVAHRKALEIKRFLKSKKLSVLGPSDARLLRLNNQYRIQLLVRHDGEASVYDILNTVHQRFNNDALLYFTHNPRMM